MKKMLSVFMAIAMVLMMAALVSASPQEKGGQDCAMPGLFKHRIAKFLNLSQEQIEKMKEVRNNFQKDTRDLKYDLAAKRLEMRKLFTDPKTDEATLIAKQKELNALRQQLMEKRGQMAIEQRRILTAEQIAKLDKLPPMRAMMKRHHEAEAGNAKE